VRENERFPSVAGLQTNTDERILSRSQRLTCPVTGGSIAASSAIEQPARQSCRRRCRRPSRPAIQRTLPFRRLDDRGA
jgi:hypothetical protein